jgi:tyrosine-protein phosphatase 2/3
MTTLSLPRLSPSLILRPFPTMDFFSLPHQKHPTSTEDEDGPTELFVKAIDDRYSNPVHVASTSTSAPSNNNNNRITPLSLSIPPIPRNAHLPSPHISSRSHSHHLPAPSPFAALFTAVSPADLPDFLSDPHTLILDIRPLPSFLASRLPHAVPLSVPSTLLKRPLFSTQKLAEMLPNRAARRRFSHWRSAPRILVYDADSAILPEGNNILGLLRKFRAEAGLPTDPRPNGGQLEPASPDGFPQLSWLKGGFQTACREQQFLLDFNTATDDDEDDDTSSPPSFADPDHLGSSEKSDPTSMASRQMMLSMPTANRPTLLRTKHLPMSAFTVSSTTSQRSGSAHHKAYAGPREFITANPSAAPATEFVSRSSIPGAPTAPQGTSNPGPHVAYNPFYDTIRQNLELSHGVTERIPLRISRIAKDRIDELPFTWLRELGRWADGDFLDDEDNFDGGSGSGISGGDHSGMSSDSGEDSGSGQEHAIGHFVRMNNPAVAPTVSPTNHAATTPEDAQAEGSEALAMQFYRIELGEQRRLMGVMEHHSKESGRIMGEGQSKSHKSKSKRSKQRSKGTGRSSRGKHGSRDFPYSITAGVEKGAKNRYVQHLIAPLRDPPK